MAMILVTANASATATMQPAYPWGLFYIGSYEATIAIAAWFAVIASLVRWAMGSKVERGILQRRVDVSIYWLAGAAVLGPAVALGFSGVVWAAPALVLPSGIMAYRGRGVGRPVVLIGVCLVLLADLLIAIVCLFPNF